MALPVIADCFRLSARFTNGSGFEVANVWHVLAPGKGETEAWSIVGPLLDTTMWHALDSDMAMIDWTILALDGVSAGITTPSSGFNGEASGDSIPGMACIVSFYTGLRGPSHRGRVFIGPIVEAQQSFGNVDSAVAAATAAAWEDFHNALVLEDMAVCVASYTHASAEPITSVVGKIKAGLLHSRQRNAG